MSFIYKIDILEKHSTNITLRGSVVFVLCFCLIEEPFVYLLANDLSLHVYISKILFATFIIYISINAYKLHGIIQATFVALILVFLKLLGESIIYYGNLLIHPGVVAVFFPSLIFVFVTLQAKNFHLNINKFLANYFLVIYALYILIYGENFDFNVAELPELNNGPFAGDTRVLHAKFIFIVCFSLLWHIDNFLFQRDKRSLLIFIISLLVIVIHQHRSVWVSSFIGVVIYFLMISKNKYFNSRAIMNILRIGLFFIISVLALSPIVLLDNEVLVSHFYERLLDVFEPTREGSTGTFRVEQTMIYTDLFFEKPILGWSFSGFELENPYVDWWEKGTGHHFHGDFIETLFYHGIFGFFIKYGILFTIIYKNFKVKLSRQTIVLSSFCISGIVFAFNYTLPHVFWALCALCFVNIQRDQSLNIDNTAKMILK